MPLYELRCTNPECPHRRVKVERFLPRYESPNPSCMGCGWATERAVSDFAVVFTGPISARYNDPSLEGAHQEGFWQYRIKSSVSGKPEPVFIDTWDKEREWRRMEGIPDPGQCGPIDAKDESGRPHIDPQSAREIVVDSNRGMQVSGLQQALKAETP